MNHLSPSIGLCLLLWPWAPAGHLAPRNAAAGGKSGAPAGKSPAPDFSSPVKTYEAYLRAVKANDLKAAKRCYVISDGNASGALDVIVGLWVTAHRLNEVARARFKDRGWAVLHEWNGMLFRDDCTDEAIDRTLARLKGARVRVRGETATLTVRWGEGEPLEKPVFHYSGDDPLAQFRRVRGAWKIDANAETGLERPADFFRPGSWGVMFRDGIAVQEQVIAALAKGKFRTEEEVIADFERRLGLLQDKYDPGWRDRESTRKAAAQAKVKAPAATDLPPASVGWSSDHRPALAVSDSGLLYALWTTPGNDKAIPSAELPPIPKELAFGPAAQPEWSAVPAVSVYRNGKWSRSGVLLQGPQDCEPSFAWCDGEQLHLLVTGSAKEQTHHLRFDPATRRWAKLAALPYRLGGYVAFRVTGKTVHAAFWGAKGLLYLRFDGRAWGEPVRVDAETPAVASRVRMAVDDAGAVHLTWWCPQRGRPAHRYAVIRDGKVSAEPLRWDGAPIDESAFDLGIDPRGRVLCAYKAALPEKHADANKMHVRSRAADGWGAPERLDGEGERLFGEIHVVWGRGRTLVTWTQAESYYGGGGVLGSTFRRMAITDGKSWTAPRWIARHPTLRGNGTPVSAMYLTVCVDRAGGVHMAWGACSYCLVARLGR